MHELGIVFHLIDTLEELARERRLRAIGSVTLELGEVSGAIPKELADCWSWAVQKRELLRGAELRIETVPAVTWCESCRTSYPTVAHGRTCPHCGSGETWLQQGREIEIREIEAQ